MLFRSLAPIKDAITASLTKPKTLETIVMIISMSVVCPIRTSLYIICVIISFKLIKDKYMLRFPH